jgi:hypothetical protein
MNMRLTKPGVAQGAWLSTGRWAAGAVLLAVTVAACTGGGSSSVPVFTPSPSGQASSTTHPATRTPSPTGGSSSTRTSGASTSPTAHPSATGSPHTSTSTRPPATTSPTASPTAAPSSAPATHTSTPVTTTYPTAAPETGGGGTAGLQDGLVFGIGGAAVFLGIGSLAYRRRLVRRFGTKRSTPTDPVDREPVDR